MRILFDLPRLLFEKKLPSIYCSYKSYEYCGNPNEIVLMFMYMEGNKITMYRENGKKSKR